MYTLYDFMPSGNGYKVRLTLRYIGQPFELIETDILTGQSRTPEFLRKNPNGRIPTLELPDGGHLSESHAICWYLAEQYQSDLLPASALARARVMEHMCFEQYTLEPNVAVRRFWMLEKGQSEKQLGERGEQWYANGLAALKVLDQRLDGRDFLVDERYTLADIALYAYTHVAHQGGFDLEPFPSIVHWCSVVSSQPSHKPITWKP